jgi:two-component system sensor histidine kinase RpfC
MVLRCVLERAGHRVESVDNGNVAFQRAISESFDLVITDHEMPGLSGLELVGRLRGADFRGKIVVHSSVLRANDAKAYREFQVDRILTKPVTLNELITAIEEVAASAD